MRRFDDHPRPYLRAGGLAYLVIILLGLFGETLVRGTLIVPGDGLATAAAIAGAPGLWRAGLAGDLLMHVLDVPLIVMFYLLLRPVSRPLALAATAFNLVQTAVLVANKQTLLAPLLLATATGPSALPPDVLAPLTLTALNLHGLGFGVGLIFFGVTCLIRGALIVRAPYLPSTLGWLLGAAGVSYLVNSLALLLAPPLAAVLFPWVLFPALVGEGALSLWLLVRGIDVDAWARFGKTVGQRGNR